MNRMIVIFLAVLCLSGCKTTVFGVSESDWNQMSEKQQHAVAQQYRSDQARKELENNLSREREPGALRRQFHGTKNHGPIYDSKDYANATPVEIKVESDRQGARWQRVAGGQIPKNAFPAGRDVRHTFYLCKASSAGNVYPGKLSQGVCQITRSGFEMRVSAYEAFVAGNNSRWVKANNGVVPSNALVGGREGKQKLYVCRTYYKGGIYPGKVVNYGSEVFGEGVSSACYFSYQGQEIHSEQFEVLLS